MPIYDTTDRNSSRDREYNRRVKTAGAQRNIKFKDIAQNPAQRRLRAWRVPKLRNGQTKYSAFFAGHLVQSMKKLGHGKPLVFLRSRDVTVTAVVMKITNKYL